MFLSQLHLQYFRNYRNQRLEFTAPKTILLGNNAQGKSNLLEAIYLLATLKSHRVSRDRELIHNDHDQAQISAYFIDKTYGIELTCKLRQGGRRSLAINGVTQTRQMDFLGNVQVVLFSCLDLELVRHTPDSRRHWLDHILLQLEPIYANLLQEYQRVLRQRNALLKSDHSQPAEWQAWNSQLVQIGSKIMRRRWRLIARLLPLAQKWHSQISGGVENIALSYAPKLECDHWDSAEAVQEALWQAIAQKQTAELIQGTSLVGPHRDEVRLLIGDRPAREYGSQGQQRTLVLALKLAELELIESVVGKTPILLLDDVLAELDLHRQNQLLSVIGDRIQTIVTTTHLASFEPSWLASAQILQVKQGVIYASDRNA